jgi:hypothetical protein
MEQVAGRHSPEKAYEGKDLIVYHFGIQKNVECYGQAYRGYASLRSGLGKTLQLQGWVVPQVSLSFIAGARSLDEEDLRKILQFFQKFPNQASTRSDRS